MSLHIGDESFAVSPGVFVQANALLHDALTDAVLAAAGRGELACDFFAGAGFFTLGLARRFARVVAVESSRVAVDDLDVNLRSAGLANVTIMGERLETLLLDEQFAGERPQVVLLDPPRTGLPPDSADALAELAPDRIVYLSCDPATQARDVRYLVGNGYAVESVEAFDLFPQTPHVECLAVLERC
jgi:23S rRNA (uracil1939-C5)-methyltransferase